MTASYFFIGCYTQNGITAFVHSGSLNGNTHSATTAFFCRIRISYSKTGEAKIYLTTPAIGVSIATMPALVSWDFRNFLAILFDAFYGTTYKWRGEHMMINYNLLPHSYYFFRP